jgi:hypothetical protein
MADELRALPAVGLVRSGELAMQSQSKCTLAIAALGAAIALIGLPRSAAADACAAQRTQLQQAYSAMDRRDRADRVIERWSREMLLQEQMKQYRCRAADISDEHKAICRALEAEDDALGPMTPRSIEELYDAMRLREKSREISQQFAKAETELSDCLRRDELDRELARARGAAAASVAPSASPTPTSCEQGKALLAAARKRGDLAAVGTLMNTVYELCAGEERARQAVRAPAPVALPSGPSSCQEGQNRVREMEAIVEQLRGAGDVGRFRAALDSLNIVRAQAKTDCTAKGLRANPCRPKSRK